LAGGKYRPILFLCGQPMAYLMNYADSQPNCKFIASFRSQVIPK
jgi:hypothetical protein